MSRAGPVTSGIGIPTVDGRRASVAVCDLCGDLVALVESRRTGTLYKCQITDDRAHPKAIHNRFCANAHLWRGKRSGEGTSDRAE